MWPEYMGGPLERVQIFILAEGLKIDFFWHYQIERGLVQNFCQSCEHFDFANLAIQDKVLFANI